MSNKKIKKVKHSNRESIFLKYKKAKQEIKNYEVETSAMLEEIDKRLEKIEAELNITEPFSNLHERLEDVEERLGRTKRGELCAKIKS